MTDSKKKDKTKTNYLSNRGYALIKDNYSHHELTELRRNLTVKPFINKQFSAGANPFSVFLESKKKLYIPRYYGIKHFGTPPKNKLKGKDVKLKFASDLRPNQIPVLEKFLEAAHSSGGGIICVPCGFGKTVLGLKILVELGKQTIIIVHKEFLMSQWVERIEQFIPDAKIGKIQGKVMKVEGYDIVIAMLQSVSMRDYPEGTFDGFGFVIYDECHHLGAEIFSRSLIKVGCQYTLGLSATPDRADGLTKVFKWFLGDIVYQIKKRDKEEVKVRLIKYYSPVDSYSKELLNFKGQIIMPKMINNITEFSPRNDVLIDEIKTCFGEGRKTLVLSDRRNHLKEIKKRLDELGDVEITSGYYLGGLKQKELKEAEGKNVMLGTFSMASEGFDCKELDTIILASPKSNIEQAVGRILRKKKEDRIVVPLIIDIIDDFSVFARQGEKRAKFYKKNDYEIEKINMVQEN